ncbi:cation/H(+) antiporter 15-like [Impatiens glandulifera]|uniref:cation/H(+) antiporter 15-like n=1 Tax=Impatiens glandulifera TaxID=253017 RepID=UPI001FB0AB13|nr:cation/H(+) antiporter 15-like [Impatiens glandulifera]
MLVTSSTIVDPTWCPDSGATDHITSDLNNLHVHAPYTDNHGILHRLSCPHTSEQNGIAERKIRHITEIGLTLLAHASMPLHYWSEAFETATYLINRLPTPTLHQRSPFETIFHSSPDYAHLIKTGIITSSSVLGRLIGHDFFEGKFTPEEKLILTSLEYLSFSFYMFLFAVKTDLNVVRSAGTLTWFIGIACSIVPLAFTVLMAFLFSNNKEEKGKRILLVLLSVALSSTSFQAISSLLKDLKLLNSEIGRIALSASLLSNAICWIIRDISNFFLFTTSFHSSYLTPYLFKSQLSRVIVVVIVVFVLRPLMIWMTKKLSEDNATLKESIFFGIVVMFLVIMYVSDILGMTSLYGALFIGLAVPTGPPLGTGVVEKLELFVTTVLLPAFLMEVGRDIDFSSITLLHSLEVSSFVFVAFWGKFLTVYGFSRYWRMPNKDALTLAETLSSRGLFDIMIYRLLMKATIINVEAYSIITLFAMMNAAIQTPLISYFYDPSKRYVNYRRRTIQHFGHTGETQILGCLHDEDQILSIANVFIRFHPTLERPLRVFIMDLMDLRGRSHPVLIDHQFHKAYNESSLQQTQTSRIINAFVQLEIYYQGVIKNHYYTSITPYASMHDDICSLALEKGIMLLIIPFQRSDSIALRDMKKNVLDKAPCSVGLIVDKKIISHWNDNITQGRDQMSHGVCVIFTRGPDSREALSLGMRMARDITVKLTVIRMLVEEDHVTENSVEDNLDIKLLQDLADLHKVISERVEYNEVVSRDANETMRVFIALEDSYDLILVGRRMDDRSPLVAGLGDWNYFEELGVIGDMLVSSDMKSTASILVLQQQTIAQDHILH